MATFHYLDISIITANYNMASYTQLISAFDGIADLIAILDSDLRIVFVNKKLIEFFNVEDSEKVIGETCFRSFHENDEICNNCPAEQTLKTGKITTVEKSLNGEILKYWTYPVFNDSDKIENAMSYGRIIIHQKKIEQELIQSEKLRGIGQLAAGVAHELNNPICSILGFSEIGKEYIVANDPLNDIFSDIIDSGTLETLPMLSSEVGAVQLGEMTLTIGSYLHTS